MTEFEMLVKMLKRIDATLKITFWENLEESVIEDITNDVTYWFKNDKLVFVENNA